MKLFARARATSLMIGPVLAGATALALMSCGIKGSKEASRGPGSTNRDPRGTIEHCSDAELAKTRTECGASNTNNTGLQLRLASNEKLSVAAGDALFLELDFVVTAKDLGDITVFVDAPTAPEIPDQQVELPSYAPGTSFCLYVPPETPAGSVTLRIKASSMTGGDTDDESGGNTQEVLAPPVQVVARVTPAIAGSTKAAGEACRDTIIKERQAPAR